MPDGSTSPDQILRRYFGYKVFRENQLEIINTLIGGKDAFVLMPTGSGKSICYQIPAIVGQGIGLVVSPLIALMQDQVDALRQNGIRAEYLNSSLAPDAADRVEANIAVHDRLALEVDACAHRARRPTETAAQPGTD